MNKKIIIANWKMNGSFDDAQIWVENFNHKLAKLDQKSLSKIVLCPPAIMIDFIDELLLESEFAQIEKTQKNVAEIEEKELEKLVANIRKINLGAQDCSPHEKGAFTGDISAKMIKDCGANYVILGHSERRQNHKESDELISEKITAAKKEGLTPILCIGESKAQRESEEFKNFLKNQLEKSIPHNLKIEKIIVAYEPIWSIGTGLIPSCKQIEETLEFIKNELTKNKNISVFKILYGGSVNAKNSGEILKTKNVDGLLVGGASLDAEGFLEIIKSA